MIAMQPRTRREVPLVLPHALLSAGLLLFAVLGERPAPVAPQAGAAAARAAHSGAAVHLARRT